MAPLRRRPTARQQSPTGSDYEVDISNSLGPNFNDDEDNSDFEIDPSSAPRKLKNPGLLDAGAILDLDNDDDQDDESFIKASQTAANKKSSNVKAKSVKKGGGFQAMGRIILC